MSRPGILSNLEFHPYVVLIAHLNSEPNRWDTCAAYPERYFTQPSREFAARCARYLNGIHRNDEILHKGSTDPKNAADPHLYNPASFVALGATDNVSLLAADDFDIIVDLTSRPEMSVRQASVAFCPKLTSLGLESTNRSCFCEISDICSSPRGEVDCHGLPRQPFLTERPLLAVTYFRLSGLAALGPGLLFQEAILKEMAIRIHKAIEQLEPVAGLMEREDIESFRCAFLDPQGWSDIATVMLCRNYSVIAAVMLELRSITFNDLYHTAVPREERSPLLTAVRQFGFHELLTRIEEENRRQRLANVDEKEHDEYRCGELLRDNHVFWATHTTVGIAHHAFMYDAAAADDAYNGFVSAVSAFALDCGHIADLENAADSKRNGLGSPLCSRERALKQDVRWYLMGQFDATEKSVFAPEHVEAVRLQHLVQRIKVLRGVGTMAQPHRPQWPIQGLCTDLKVPIPRRALTPTPRAHINVRPILTELRNYMFGRQIDKDELESARADQARPPAQCRETPSAYDTRSRSRTGAKEAPLSIRFLKDAIRALRIPAPLSVGFLYLYVDYAKCLSDPILFDNVLDLHDCFSAVYRAITREMPRDLQRRLSRFPAEASLQRELTTLSHLTAGDVQELTALINLLQSALQHRTRTPFSTNEWWHAPVDFKGETNKLVNAVDVPLYCGLSVLRRILDGEVALDGGTRFDVPVSTKAAALLADERADERRCRVGGTCKLSYDSRAMTRRFRIGDRDINFIAELSLNINHLVRPSVLYAHLHEVGHMVSELIGGGLAGPSRACSTDAACSYAGIANCFTVTDRANKAAHEPTDTDQLNARRERYEEIFAEMFGYGLVFADYVEGQGDGSFMAYRSAPGHRNLRTFMRFSTAMYFLDPVSTTGEPARVLLKLSEVLTRFFLAAYPFTHPMRQDGSKKPLYESGDGLDSYEPSSADLRKASHLFHEAVADAGPFLPHYQRFREVPEAQDYLAEHFRKAFTSSYRPVRCIWGHVSRILQSVFFDWKKSNWAGGIGTNPCPKDHWALVRELKKGYRQGRPAIRLLYDDPRSDSVYLTAGGEECNYRMEDMEKRTHADALFVVRHLLRIHVSEVFDRMDVAKQVCLLRGSESTEDVNSQLVDRFFGGLFCTDFSKRKDYLRGRIALIKTLSDLSMNIRGRTFRRILAQFAHDSFPDRFDPPRDS